MSTVSAKIVTPEGSEELDQYASYGEAKNAVIAVLKELVPEAKVMVKPSKKGHITKLDAGATQQIVVHGNSDFHALLEVIPGDDDPVEEPSLIEEDPQEVVAGPSEPTLVVDNPKPTKSAKNPPPIPVGEKTFWGCDQTTVSKWVDAHREEVLEHGISVHHAGKKFALKCNGKTIWTSGFQNVAEYAAAFAAESLKESKAA